MEKTLTSLIYISRLCQRCVDLEKKLLDAQKLAEAESAKQVDLRSQLESSAKKLEEAMGKLKAVDDTHEVSLASQLRLQQRNDQLENEKRELAVGLERKNAAIEQLSQDFKVLSTGFCFLPYCVPLFHNYQLTSTIVFALPHF